MSNQTNYVDTFGVPILTGLISGLTVMAGYENSSSARYNLGPIDLSAAVGVGLVTGGGSMLGNVATDYILPKVTPNTMTSRAVQKLTKPVVSGVSTLGATRMTNLQDNGMLKAFAIGAGSNILAEYGYNTGKQILYNGASG